MDSETIAKTAASAVTDGNPNGFATKSGRCAQFVRQVVQFVNPALWQNNFHQVYNLDSDSDGDVDAIDVERNLLSAGKGVRLEELGRGDIVFFNRNGGPNGHVAIYLGGGKIAENSSRTSGVLVEGDGALKISNLSATLRSRITSVCRLAPVAASADHGLPEDSAPLFSETAQPVQFCHNKGFIQGDGNGHYIDIPLTIGISNTILGRANVGAIPGNAGDALTRGALVAWLAAIHPTVNVAAQPADQHLKLTSLCYVISYILNP